MSDWAIPSPPYWLEGFSVCVCVCVCDRAMVCRTCSHHWNHKCGNIGRPHIVSSLTCLPSSKTAGYGISHPPPPFFFFLVLLLTSFFSSFLRRLCVHTHTNTHQLYAPANTAMPGCTNTTMMTGKKNVMCFTLADITHFFDIKGNFCGNPQPPSTHNWCTFGSPWTHFVYLQLAVQGKQTWI